MNETLWILFITFVSSAGFAYIFNMPQRWVVPSALGGMMVWMVYLALCKIFQLQLFMPSFIASIGAGLWAFGLARISKNPFGMYFMIAVVPLIPGSGLYYTIYNLSQSDFVMAAVYAKQTTILALAIACGISVVWAGIEIYRRYKALHNPQ